MQQALCGGCMRVQNAASQLEGRVTTFRTREYLNQDQQNILWSLAAAGEGGVKWM